MIIAHSNNFLIYFQEFIIIIIILPCTVTLNYLTIWFFFVDCKNAATSIFIIIWNKC